ncbi:hypothetical protein [Streptomyces sp. NPDC051684]|uniref:hypothetical protein n=1 Tax=Streptomyces sp. NPDC051684 TaxID=3365670 RepID=UPI0037979F96
MSSLYGYRESDRVLLTGNWPPGELLAAPLTGRPALAEPVRVQPPRSCSDERLYLTSAGGFVRFVEVDWVVRRARLEIGLQEEARAVVADVLAEAVAVAADALGLRRLYGWLTPTVPGQAAAVAAAEAVGFRREATVPQALWHAGEAVDRDLWGIVHDD